MPKTNEFPKKAFKYRIDPNKEAEQIFNWTLEKCWEINKVLVKEKITAYKKKQKQPSQFDQAKEVRKIKEQKPKLYQIFSQVLQNIPKQRVPAIWLNFQKRKKENLKAGLPQPKPLHRYRSSTYPQHGFKLEKGQLVLSQGRGYPELRVDIKLHTQLKNGKKEGRPLPIEKVKTLTIYTKNKKWYACFACEIENKKPLTLKQLKASKHLGLDMGLESYYTTQEGYKEPVPQFYCKAEKKLIKLDRIGSRKKHKRNKGDKTKPSQRYIKYQLKVNKFKEKVANQRDDFVFKQVKELRDNYDYIGIEELEIEKMIECQKYWGLPKIITDVGWNKFHKHLSYTMVEMGKKVETVDPRNTSKQCFQCKKINPNIELKDREFVCADYPNCDYKEDRDINAAKNILYRARLKTFGAGTVSLANTSQ